MTINSVLVVLGGSILGYTVQVAFDSHAGCWFVGFVTGFILCALQWLNAEKD